MEQETFLMRFRLTYCHHNELEEFKKNQNLNYDVAGVVETTLMRSDLIASGSIDLDNNPYPRYVFETLS